MTTTRSRKLPNCLQSYKNQLQHSLVDSCFLNFNRPFTPTFNQLGGRAYNDQHYPIIKDQKGCSMQLLVQIDFSSLTLSYPFPSKGLLQIFVNNGFGKEEAFIEEDQFQIRFIEHVPSIPMTFEVETIEKEIICPLFFSPIVTKEYVSAYDYRLPQYVENIETFVQEEARTFLDVYSDYMLGADHKIGGYPYFLEKDFRLLRPDLQKFDTLLFQLVSDDSIGFNYRDSGIVSFFIEGERLANKDFSNVYMHIESY